MERKIYWESSHIFNPHITAIVRFVVEGVAKLVFVSVVIKAGDSPASTL